MTRTNANKFPQVITKYGHTCATTNFRYLMKNLVIYQVNLNDGLIKIIKSPSDLMFMCDGHYDNTYKDFTYIDFT